MAANQPRWPSEWLMTDERMGDRLFEAIGRMPRGGGIVFRHYGLGAERRRQLAHEIAAAARTRDLLMAVAEDVVLGDEVGAVLIHNPARDPENRSFSRSAHSEEEVRYAVQAGASLIFLSPIFPTRSHPDRAPLAPEEVRRILADCPARVIALGGMNRARFLQSEQAGFYGWAGIDAWLSQTNGQY
jgi:thiamine-phosphate pyrophosphorylase